MTKILFGELSIDQIRSAIYDQLRMRFGTEADFWIRDMYQDSVVIERDAKLYRLGYTLTDTTVTVSDQMEEVTQEYVPATGESMFGDFGGQWIEIFRAGDYGAKGSYTAEDLVQLAASYDPKASEAPLVVGHPKVDAPAYGWVSKLKADNGLLFAQATQVEPQFEQMVQDGRFKKRSVAVRRNDAGALQLVHVGFLGAMAPEVKGLADIKFGQAEFETIDFEEGPMPEDMKKTFTESLKEFFGGKKVFTDEEVAAQVKAATDPLSAKIAAFEAADATRAQNKQQFSERATAAIANVKNAGKWIPAYDRMGVPQVFEALAGSTVTVEFGEGEAKKTKTAAEMFADFLQALPKMVPVGEIATATAAAQQKATVKFNESRSASLDEESVLFMEEADRRSKDRNIPYGTALREIYAEGWKPAVTGATAGKV